MQGTLTKPWGRHPEGTVVVDPTEDGQWTHVKAHLGQGGSIVRVNAARFQRLQDEGYLAADLSEKEQPGTERVVVAWDRASEDQSGIRPAVRATSGKPEPWAAELLRKTDEEILGKEAAAALREKEGR